MNYSTHRLSLDLHDTSSCHMIYCKKGDTARQIAIDLNESGVPYIISEDCSAALVGTKPDKNRLFHACEIKNNVIYYKFNEQTAPVVGQVDCEIRIYGGDGELITSAGFAIVVEDVECTDGEILDSVTEMIGLPSLISPSDIGAAEEIHQHTANTITGGMFAGLVQAGYTSQPATGICCLRNSMLLQQNSSYPGPNHNGEIYWYYE